MKTTKRQIIILEIANNDGVAEDYDRKEKKKEPSLWKQETEIRDSECPIY